MTTDRQTDYFKKYANVEAVSGNGSMGHTRYTGQLKNGRWALWDSATYWGGNSERPRRIRDLDWKPLSFATKEEAIEASERIK